MATGPEQKSVPCSQGGPHDEAAQLVASRRVTDEARTENRKHLFEVLVAHVEREAAEDVEEDEEGSRS